MSKKRWEIYRANLDPVIGSEQEKTRPVLIISDDGINSVLNVVNVLPLTSRKPERVIYPNEYFIKANNFGLTNDSIVLCYQIRTIDKKRLSVKFGEVNDLLAQNEIIEALCFQLGIVQ